MPRSTTLLRPACAAAFLFATASAALALADTSGVAIVAGEKAMLLKGSHDANEIHAYLDTLPEPLRRLERAEPWLIAIQ